MKPAATVQRPIGLIADLSSRPRVTCPCSCCPSSHPRALPSSLPAFSDQHLQTTPSDPEERPAPSSTSCLRQLARGRYFVAVVQSHSALVALCAIPRLQPCSQQQRSTPYARTCVSLAFQWPRQSSIFLQGIPASKRTNSCRCPNAPIWIPAREATMPLSLRPWTACKSRGLAGPTTNKSRRQRER